MAFEIERRRHSLKIPIQDENEYAFYIWVTDAISFKMENGIGQEVRLTMHSEPGDTTRKVQVNEVDVGGTNPLKYEVISKTNDADNNGIGQETTTSWLTDSSQHNTYHDVTINARKTDGTESSSYTLTIRKIDKFYVKNSNGIGQEAWWTLDNRDDEDKINFKYPDSVYDKDQGALRLDWFQVVKEPDEQLCMLVLYNDNQIAYAPMGSIKSLTGKVKTKTLSNSDWSKPGWFNYQYEFQNVAKFFIITGQARFNSKITALTWPLSISDSGVIKLQSHLEQRPMFNSASTIFKSADCSTPFKDAGVSADDYRYGNYPVFNAGSSKIYNQYLDEFTITSSGIARTSTGEAPTFGWDKTTPDLYGPTHISTTGDRYSDVNYSTSAAGGVGNGDGRDQSAYSSTLYQKLQDFINTIDFSKVHVLFWFHSGPGNSDLPGGSYSTNDDNFSYAASNTTKYSIYDTNTVGGKKYDVYSPTEAVFTATTTAIEGNIGVTMNMFGVTLEKPASEPRTRIQSYFGRGFPLNIGVTSTQIYHDYLKFNNDLLTWSRRIVTPYESWDADQADRFLHSTYFGWLQVSNGDHLLQGYIKMGKRRLYLDKVEWGSTLANAIGCDVEDIQSVVFDIKKTDIDKLK